MRRDISTKEEAFAIAYYYGRSGEGCDEELRAELEERNGPAWDHDLKGAYDRGVYDATCEDENADDEQEEDSDPLKTPFFDSVFDVRGFRGLKFKDRYGKTCKLQNSSLATCDAIWFGLNDAEPQVTASQAAALGIKAEGTGGWVPYPLPPEVFLSTTMHLTRTQVKQLLPVLQHFVTYGELPSFEHAQVLARRTQPSDGVVTGRIVHSRPPVVANFSEMELRAFEMLAADTEVRAPWVAVCMIDHNDWDAPVLWPEYGATKEEVAEKAEMARRTMLAEYLGEESDGLNLDDNPLVADYEFFFDAYPQTLTQEKA